MCQFLSALVLRNGDVLSHPRFDSHAVLVVGIVGIVVGLIAHAIQWYRALGRACVLSRDPVIGRDQHRPERQAILSAVQADQRQRLNSVVSLSERRRPTEGERIH